LFGYGGVVGDYDDRTAVVMGEGAEDLDYVGGVGRVEISRGLVGEDDLAALGESSCDRDTLLLAAREVGGEAFVVCGRKLNALAHLDRKLCRLLFRHFLEIERVHYVLLHGQKREEVVILIDNADGITAEAIAVPIFGGLAVDDDLTLGGDVESRHKREKCGLTRTRLADDGIALSGLEIIGHAVHRADGLIFSFVAVRYVVKRNTHLFILLDVLDKFFTHKYCKREAEGDEVGDGEDREVVYRVPIIIRTADHYAEDDTDHLLERKTGIYSCVRFANNSHQHNISLAAANHKESDKKARNDGKNYDKHRDGAVEFDAVFKYRRKVKQIFIIYIESVFIKFVIYGINIEPPTKFFRIW